MGTTHHSTNHDSGAARPLEENKTLANLIAAAQTLDKAVEMTVLAHKTGAIAHKVFDRELCKVCESCGTEFIADLLTTAPDSPAKQLLDKYLEAEAFSCFMDELLGKVMEQVKDDLKAAASESSGTGAKS